MIVGLSPFDLNCKVRDAVRYSAYLFFKYAEPGLGVTLDRRRLDTLHRQTLECGVRNRNDLAQMHKYDPPFTGHSPRY